MFWPFEEERWGNIEKCGQFLQGVYSGILLFASEQLIKIGFRQRSLSGYVLDGTRRTIGFLVILHEPSQFIGDGMKRLQTDTFFQK